MSDLQCPARFLVLAAPGASAAGWLRHERVAVVYDDPAESATAGDLGRALGVPVQHRGARVDLAAVLDRDPASLETLEDLADHHRGETVVLIAAGPAGGVVEVTVDADRVTVTELAPGPGG